MSLLLVGILFLVVGLGNFYVGYTKSVVHQENLQTLTAKNNSQVENLTSTNDENLAREIKKVHSRANYYKIALIGGTVFILIGLLFIFTMLCLRL